VARINYQALRGKAHAFAPAQPPDNPHLWVLLDTDDQQWFATINVRSNKDQPGEPLGKSYLYYLIDTDFAHPIVPSILARPLGLSPVDRSYAGGAIDFQRGNLFNPNDMRVLPPEGAGDDGLVHRLSGLLGLARSQNCDVFFYGNAFPKNKPNQTDAAFGYTPDTPFGLDNVHMAQGDPREVNKQLRENGVWHDGACFIWDPNSHRMTAIFLAFQSQGWHTNDDGDLIFGATGCEAPTYDFSTGAGVALPLPKRAAEITSAHRTPDGAASVVVANMGAGPLDLTGWRLLVDTVTSFPLPAANLSPGQPLSAPLPAGSLSDAGGLLTLINSSQLRVDGAAYLGGDPAEGWSTSFG
jgi:uncharacterized protein YukJ